MKKFTGEQINFLYNLKPNDDKKAPANASKVVHSLRQLGTDAAPKLIGAIRVRQV